MTVNILFDYDGTLHDSLHIYHPAVQTAYDRLADSGLAPHRIITNEEARQWIGLAPAEMWHQLLPHLSQRAVRHAVQTVGQIMQEEIAAGNARLYDGVPELLNALRTQGYRLILLSNCPRTYLQAHTKQFSLDRYFDGLYCSECFGYRPKHELFSYIRQEHPGKYIIVGDRRQDMDIAAVHHLESIGCSYGYGSAEELQSAACLAPDLTSLARILLHSCGSSEYMLQ